MPKRGSSLAPETLHTEVLIVGAGPTGLSLAAQLQRQSIASVICDPKSGPTPLSKALVVHARTLEIYDQLGLAKRAVAQGERLQQVVLSQAGQVRARVSLAELGAGLSPFPFALIFEQSHNEALLLAHLQAQGYTPLWQTALDSLQQDAEGVTALLRRDGQADLRVCARYLVGCDGASSPTRHQLGLGFQGSTRPQLFFVADVEMDDAAEPGTFYPQLGKRHFVLRVPMTGTRRWRLIGNLPDQDTPPVFADVAQGLLSQLQPPLQIERVNWFSSYRVHTRHAESFAQGRCFLAGDAAHVHTPTGGQGMNTGIQDAYNLAWKLAFVLRGQARPALLDTYNQERLANARRLLRSTDRFFQLATGTGGLLAVFRERVMLPLAPALLAVPLVRRQLFPLVSQTGIHYRHSPLSQAKRLPFACKAGDRLPYFRLDGHSIYARLQAPVFHLLLFAQTEAALPPLTQALLPWKDHVQIHALPLTADLKQLFHSTRPFLLLLRPDHHIALLSQDLSGAAAVAFFKTWLP
ncbi:MAG: FAD-dependent monooxygenase [Candidatus Sericytochromatia bacterium]